MERYTPYARYSLIFMSAWLLASDSMPPSMAAALQQMALDPVIVSDLAGVIAGLVALVWYHGSRARAALNALFS